MEPCRIGVTKMRIRPILPLWIMVVLFVILFGMTIFMIFRNKTKITDKIFILIRLFLIYVLALIIGIRPVTVEKKYEVTTKNLNVLFVVDTTISMWAQDYNGNNTRMEAVKKDAEYIIDELEGCNFGVISFDDSSRIQTPFTQDPQYIKDFFESFKSPESFYARGSDLSIPYHDMETMLKSSAKKEDRNTIIFYISDGEITNDKDLKSYSGLAKYIDGGAVMGYGSKEGGKMPEGDNGEYYIYDYSTHSDAISKIDEQNLKKIASDLGVSYYSMYDQDESFMGLVQTLKNSTGIATESGTGAETDKDMYYLFAIPLAFMLALELIIAAIRGRL